MSLTGKVIALIGPGSPLHRALAVGCAEAGANIALATIAPSDEFAVASIANEVWAVGREQFVEIMTATDPTAAASLADETFDRLGSCDALIWIPSAGDPAPLDELSHEEWVAALDAALTAPYLAAQAFGRLMERAGGGSIVLLAPEPGGNAATETAAAGLAGLASAINRAWNGRGVRATVVSPAPVAIATAQGVIAQLSS